VIVGGGMIGSSAAKHTAKICSEKNINARIALIGVAEEDQPESHLYGAWSDEARITRLLDKSDCWRNLAEKSLLRYELIEDESGIKFYNECGFLSLIDEQYEDQENLDRAMAILLESGYKCLKTEARQLRNMFPFLNIKEDIKGYFQPDCSGYINPRKMIEAQLEIAQNYGCQVIRSGLSRISQDDKSMIFTLKMTSGQEVQSRNVILAMGAYFNISSILSPFTAREMELSLTSQTIAYIRVSAEEAERLSNMPTLVTSYHSEKLDGTYILPPVLYPDGQYYLKLGHHDKFEGVLSTAEEVEEWYRAGTGDKEAVEELERFIMDFVRDLGVEAVSGGCCVTSKTKDKSGPYIDCVKSGLFVAGGGCGYAAKSCDEIGRIAAVLSVTGDWDSDIARDIMTIKWRENTK